MKNISTTELDLASRAILFDKIKSVRTTFKLSDKCIKNIDEIITAHSIKPKELFDMIDVFKDPDFFKDVIEKEIIHDNLQPQMEVRKTFVISAQAKSKLDKLSAKTNYPRDMIVEAFIFLINISLEERKRDETLKEKEAFKKIKDLEQKALDIEKELKILLDDDNPIITRFGACYVVLQNLTSAIEDKFKNGVSIDPDGL